MRANRLHLFARLGVNNLHQIHWQIRDSLNLSLVLFGNEVTIIIAQINDESIVISQQEFTAAFTVSQCFGIAVAGFTATRFTTNGVWLCRSHVQTALPIFTTAFFKRQRVTNHIVDDIFAIRPNNRKDNLATRNNRGDAPFTIDTQNRIFPTEIGTSFTDFTRNHQTGISNTACIAGITNSNPICTHISFGVIGGDVTAVTLWCPVCMAGVTFKFVFMRLNFIHRHFRVGRFPCTSFFNAFQRRNNVVAPSSRVDNNIVATSNDITEWVTACSKNISIFDIIFCAKRGEFVILC